MLSILQKQQGTSLDIKGTQGHTCIFLLQEQTIRLSDHLINHIVVELKLLESFFLKESPHGVSAAFTKLWKD